MPDKSIARKEFGVYDGKQHPIRVAFRRNFRALRIAEGKSSYKIGGYLGVSQAYCSELESPKEDKVADAFMLQKIGDLYGIEPFSLLIPGMFSGKLKLEANLNSLNTDQRDELRSKIEVRVKRGMRRLRQIRKLLGLPNPPPRSMPQHDSGD